MTNLLPEGLMKLMQKLKNSSTTKIEPRKWLQTKADLDNLHAINMVEDARQCLDISRRELEAQAMDRQPKMKEAEGDEMGSQIGDNVTINMAPEKPLSSGLAKTAIIALAASTGIGAPIGIGLSMMGGGQNTVIESPADNKIQPGSIKLGKPDE